MRLRILRATPIKNHIPCCLLAARRHDARVQAIRHMLLVGDMVVDLP